MHDNLDNLRHIEGFPIGKDEDLHALSDPPHFTVYPNPHIAEFIRKCGSPYDETHDEYHREPFVGDVSEGKSDRIYRVHSYHTKVPHLAIRQFIEHYTEKGDIVLDCFAGTGMTGVAAQLAGRHAILIELSPFATSIAYSLNNSDGLGELDFEANQIIERVEKEAGHLFQAEIGSNSYPLAYCVWSADVECPYCSKFFTIWDVTVDENNWTESDTFKCPKCKAELDYPRCHKIPGEDGFTRFSPVKLSIVRGNKRIERRPTQSDIEKISVADSLEIAYWYPDYLVMDGEKLSEPKNAHGLTKVSQFYTRRTLHILSNLWDKVTSSGNPKLQAAFTATLRRVTRMNRYMAKHKLNRSRELVGPLDKTAHIPSIYFEANPLLYFKEKAAEYSRLQLPKGTNIIISTQSAIDLSNVPSDSVDYIFIDPPFGANIQYAELNFIFESWLRVFSNDHSEAIVSSFKQKANDDYRILITKAFQELYRVLKPNRWITVEFHSSSAAIWNIIQDSLAKAGFVVVQVAILDKQKGTINQLTSPSSVNNDLIINAYKPKRSFSLQLILQSGRGLESEFTKQLLKQLPLETNIGRSKEMLYSKYLAYYVQHGYTVQYNGEQFYRALLQWGFIERDGYWFEDEVQAQEYEQRKVRQTTKGSKQTPTDQQVLFISDEKSARQWLWVFLSEPKTYDEIYTAFVKALQTSQDQIPELKEMLEEGFVRTNGNWKRPDAFTQVELEKRRQERLLHQFNEYLNKVKAGQRLKEVRLRITGGWFH